MSIRKLFSISLAIAAISIGGGSSYAAVPHFGDGSLKLWLDADNVAGNNTTPLDGSLVSTWADLSGNGNNAIQTGTGAKPTYVSNGINGNPVVRFDGANDLLDAGAGFPIIGNGLTIFTVLRFTSSSGSQGILGNRGGGAGYMLGEEGPPTFNDRFQFVGGTTLLSSGPTTPNSLNGQKLVLAALKDGGTLTMFTNAIPFATSGGDGALTDIGNAVTIGTNPQQGFYNGDLAEILIYDRALNAVERQAVNEYFFANYSIPEPASAALCGLAALLLWRRRGGS